MKIRAPTLNELKILCDISFGLVAPARWGELVTGQWTLNRSVTRENPVAKGEMLWTQ
jgi:hypothetical protein